MSTEQKLVEKFEQRANQRIFIVNLVSLLVGFVSLLSVISVAKAAVSIAIGIGILLVPFFLDRRGIGQKYIKYAYIMIIVFIVGVFFIILGEGNQSVPFVYFVTIILAAFYNNARVLYITAGWTIVQNIGLYLLFSESFYYNYDNTSLTNMLIIFLLATYVVASLLKENKKLVAEVIKNESDVAEMLDMNQRIFNDVKDFTKQLNKCSELLDSSAGDVGSSSQEISTSLEQMSVSIEQQVHNILTISKNSEEINGTIHSIFKRTQETTSASQDSLARSKKSGQALKNIRENMEHIGGTVNDAVLTIQELGENSQEIGNIVNVIKNVTNQTNLLALNASIEAARAGEHGKGFAVVAEEIKSLADQSVQATENISQIIHFIQTKIDEATANINQGEEEVKETIGQIGIVTNEYDSVLDTLTNVVTEIGDVANNLEGIASHNDQVTTLVENLSFSSEENSASIEEVSASMEEQTAMTYTLQDISGNLKEIVAKLSVIMEEVQTEE